MLRAAVFSGADCVFLGVDGFNARRGAANFAGDALAEATAFCHARNCKVYAALNTLVLPGEEPALLAAAQSVANAGCDAVIVQDLAVADVVRRVSPQLPLHASTQMSVHSLAGVQMLATMGFSRAILARELSLEEIAFIASRSPLELEVFVHGALCVSVSGQCLMSAFLGGRSANRGACAGPCRLPFTPCAGELSSKSPATHPGLSLKDLSILDALPSLSSIGIACVKIEGRLRGPEYCATAVDCARKALNGEAYDRELLQNVFSRDGFTDAWFAGQNNAGIFGARTEADTAAAKTALPRTRALYRREAQQVPVSLSLSLGPNGGLLSLTDGTHSLHREIPGPLHPAQNPPDDVLRTTLAKMGGTPFYAEAITIESNGLHYPGPAAGALRRELLEELLRMREAPPAQSNIIGSSAAISFSADACPPSHAKAARTEHGPPLLCARFEHISQLPQNAEEICREFIFPLHEAAQIPPALRPRSWLWLPRTLFGNREQLAAQAIEASREMGFLGYEVSNLAHLHLCKGLPMRGGFGLNVTNWSSAACYLLHGCRQLTLSPELSLRQMQALAASPGLSGLLSADALCYGHLPLMITRACPLKQITDCGTCNKNAYLVDRKGERFPLLCRGDMRHIFNPVPLWMADRLADFPTDTATLYFTTETVRQAEDILAAFAAGSKAPGNFTRGLYDRGLSG